MIKRTNLSPLRLMAFAQTMKNVKTFLENESDLSGLGLSGVKTEFDDAFDALENAMKPVRKNEHTKTLAELDSERDAIFTGLKQYALSFLNFPDEAKKKSAQRIEAIFESYGKDVTKRAYRDVTAIIRNLLSDFEKSENQSHVNALGITQWVAPLKEANEQFDVLHSNRTMEQSKKELGKTQEARDVMQGMFDKLGKAISAMAFVNGEEKYRNLANAINEEVKRALL